ncbi:MAG: hypothetical protein CM1200mP2_45060 [Planctomycetaceae bacterium]|nr:MAG: hypothetical protein CM1200mP2_45060 [Planctomycetaceae bacterium]
MNSNRNSSDWPRQATSSGTEVLEAFGDFRGRLRQRTDQTFNSLIWIAETYSGLGQGATEKTRAATFFGHAAESYQQILDRADQLVSDEAKRKKLVPGVSLRWPTAFDIRETSMGSQADCPTLHQPASGAGCAVRGGRDVPGLGQFGTDRKLEKALSVSSPRRGWVGARSHCISSVSSTAVRRS